MKNEGGRLHPLSPIPPPSSSAPRRPRLLISGYYGYANTGDEAILAGLVAGFRSLCPQVELVVLSADPALTAAWHGVEAVPGRSLVRVWRELRRADLLVSGGGGLLQDTSSWRSPLYYLGVIMLARLAGRPAIIFAQGIGPLRRRWVRWLCRLALNGVQAITVRDPGSAQELRRLGVRRPAAVAADQAFLMKDEGVSAIGNRAAHPSQEHPLIGVALRAWPSLPAGRVGAGLCQAIRRIGGGSLLALPFQWPGDREVSEQVQAVAQQAGMACPLSAGRLPPQEMLRLVSRCELLVGMRLHSLIFAAMAGVPLVGISYDPKVDQLLRSLGMEPAASVESLEPEPLAKAIHQAWLDRQPLRDRLLSSAAHAREQALLSQRMALELIGISLPASSQDQI